MAKVALIAVHGVGYHSPGASANAMADLLHSLRTPSVSAPGPARTYTAFEADAIHIPLQPVPVTPLPMPDKPFKFLQAHVPRGLCAWRRRKRFHAPAAQRLHWRR